MIISKKRFEKKVRKDARELYQAKMTSLVQEAHSRELLRMNRRIDELEKELKKKGSIHGFYATPTETTIVRKEGEHNEDA